MFSTSANPESLPNLEKNMTKAKKWRAFLKVNDAHQTVTTANIFTVGRIPKNH
jgi:hypothetical protein